MCYPAHIRNNSAGEPCVQTVAAHCRGCAQYAAAAAPAGMEKTAYLAGLLHDMGKYTAEFRAYLTAAAAGKVVRPGSVNHTFAGVRFAMERWHKGTEQTYPNIASEIIAYAAGAHHGQFDCIAPDGADGFHHRITTEGIGYAQAWENFLTSCAAQDELDELFASAVQEVTAALAQFRPLAKTAEELFFYFGMLARQVLSAVIEGDRRDTAEFMLDVSFDARKSTGSDCWRERLCAVERRILGMPVRSEMDQARQSISAQCREAAGRGGGIFRLTVPTGGGKTLAALRYALAAAADGKRRIFFVIPLLSVLEQNARVIHDYLGDDSMILEHHSNLVREKTGFEELDENELLLANWHAPIVITTLVQLLDTLLAGKTSCIRRMSALSGSVIVIDEVQSVPRNMLSEFNLALNFLMGFCGATVVLCSATQPCLEQTRYPLRYAENPELVPHDPALWEVFRRTEIFDRRRPSGYTIEELAAFAVSCAEDENSLLLICNTKAQAKKIFAVVRERWSGDLFHLSTAMCMQHRIETLSKIHIALENRARVICVSTQLVEAGVDFSFGCVIRVSAGMDNVVQAAGRCNRNSEYARRCPVYIVKICGENLNRLPEIQQAQQAAESLLLRYERTPEAFGHDLTSEAAIRTYYRTLYTEMKQGSQDYPLPKYDTTLFDLLSRNGVACARSTTKQSYTITQAFRTAGEQFHVFEDNTSDLLVPFGEGEELITALGSDRAKYDLAYRASLVQKAGRFSVSLYEHERKRLLESGGVYPLCQDTLQVLRPEFYSEEIGFSLHGDVTIFAQV